MQIAMVICDITMPLLTRVSNFELFRSFWISLHVCKVCFVLYITEWYKLTSTYFWKVHNELKMLTHRGSLSFSINPLPLDDNGSDRI